MYISPTDWGQQDPDLIATYIRMYRERDGSRTRNGGLGGGKEAWLNMAQYQWFIDQDSQVWMKVGRRGG